MSKTIFYRGVPLIDVDAEGRITIRDGVTRERLAEALIETGELLNRLQDRVAWAATLAE